jgi:S-adenosylmethionine-diacylglycerol 3-amino-3-carboxypropyl transferase
LDVALQSESPVSTLRGSDLGNALHAAFLDVMKLENLVCLFGTVATQNPKRSFGEHFAARTLGIFERMPPCSNPFLWQILAGKFPPGHCYDWLNPFHAPTADAHWHCGKMDDVLDSLSPESADLVHLSNILDWLPAESAQAMLDKACRVLKPGGLIIIRQLNSTLDIPSINSKFVWDEELGRSMEQTDRSYFYPGIFIGRRA